MVCELFFCQISSNSNDWILTNRQVSAKAIGLNFLSNCTCAAFNWVFLILKNLRIAGFFASLRFLTYLCHKRLKPSTHCIQLRRKIAKIEWALSTKNDRCINGMFVFAILEQVLNRISMSAQKLCSATLTTVVEVMTGNAQLSRYCSSPPSCNIQVIEERRFTSKPF